MTQGIGLTVKVVGEPDVHNRITTPLNLGTTYYVRVCVVNVKPDSPWVGKKIDIKIKPSRSANFYEEEKTLTVLASDGESPINCVLFPFQLVRLIKGSLCTIEFFDGGEKTVPDHTVQLDCFDAL